MNTREKVIAALEKEKGAYVSGEALAKTCNVSRNAIWKSINELRKSGYPIESVNNRGYKLDEGSDIISKAGICMYLQMKEEHEGSDRYDREEPVLSGNDMEADSKKACTGFIDPDRIYVYRELDKEKYSFRKCPYPSRDGFCRYTPDCRQRTRRKQFFLTGRRDLFQHDS